MKKTTLVLILIASAALACNTRSGSGSQTAQSGDPKAAVIDASRNFVALNSLSGKIVGEGETPLKQQVDYVAPDRYHVRYDDQTGAQTEMIIIGKDGYIGTGDNSWSKMPPDSASPPTLRMAFSDEALKSVTDAKFEGEETVDGKPATVYSYKIKTPIGDQPVASKMWIAKDSGLPVKSYVEFASGPLKNLTVTYNTDAPVKIEPPAVK